MGVQLREKKLGNGQVSFYLDIYHNKKRWYEFLDIHAAKTRPSAADQEKKRLAIEIKIRRENELIVNDHGLVDKGKKKGDFVQWYAQYNIDRKLDNTHNRSTLKHLVDYQDGRPLPFNSITPEWINKYIQNHLLKKVSNNTAFDYIRNMFTALEDAVRQDIISTNPFRKIPRHERMKRKPIFRNAFTLDELQILANTPLPAEPQYKQAYLFSCFTGLRWSDVNPLRWTEIITKTIKGKKEWFIHFEQEKTEDIEYLPLSDLAVEILKARKTEQQIELEEGKAASLFVFPNCKEKDMVKHSTHKRMDYYLKNWADDAGIGRKRMHFHSARHTFATNVLENSPEGDLWTVSKLLGHKSISATQIYAHVRDSRKTAAVKALPKLDMTLAKVA